MELGDAYMYLHLEIVLRDRKDESAILRKWAWANTKRGWKQALFVTTFTWTVGGGGGNLYHGGKFPHQYPLNETLYRGTPIPIQVQQETEELDQCWLGATFCLLVSACTCRYMYIEIIYMGLTLHPLPKLTWFPQIPWECFQGWEVGGSVADVVQVGWNAAVGKDDVVGRKWRWGGPLLTAQTAGQTHQLWTDY